MPSESPPFRIWLRRTSSSTSSFALRFEAFDGKGVLRVARPGVLVDPPARVSGYEADISSAGVRASRFLHVSSSQRKRDTWFMSRLTEELLESLPLDTWGELNPEVDRGAHHLVLTPPPMEEVPVVVLPEPEPPAEHDEFRPHPAVEHIPLLPDTLEPVYAEDLVPLETEEAPDTDEEPMSEELGFGALMDDEQDVTEITRSVLESGLAQVALQPAEVAAPKPVAPLQPPEPLPPPPPPPERRPEPRGPISPNGLVRHLRRQLSAANAEIAALNAQIALLERKLSASELTPLAMESDTDEL